jgi:diguanylate cyclase (GGDEF)-like protein/PAS domain S-box-containing protein
MNILDMRTVIVLSVIINIICTLFIVQLWRQNRRRFAGMAFWVLDFIFQALALVLIILRGAIPNWMSMVLSNTLVIAGAILAFIGLERFVGKKAPQIHNYLLLAFFIIVHSYFILVRPSLEVRNLNLSVVLLLVCFQCLWLLWRRVEPGLRSLTFWVGAVFGLYCLVSIVRIVEYFVGVHAEDDYFHSGAFQTLVLVSYQMLLILLTYGLVLMVNKRLLMEIGAQEEIFAKAFQTSPYGITITSATDGKFINVNSAFTAITGFTRKEALAGSSIGMRLWVNEDDRRRVVADLQVGQAIVDQEVQFRTKSGEVITGLFSAQTIQLSYGPCILSSIGDITARKRIEEALKESENRYRELSIIDDLTQLYNSRHFYHQLKMEIDRADRYGQPLTLLLLDLDNFKAFNDAYGHIEGDQVLRRLGQVVKRCLRQTDSAYRYGGEEFTILLPMTTSADGVVTAERIRTEFKKETFSPAPGQEVHVMVSTGLAQYKPQEDMKAFVQRVDQLMYQGKKNGKDRVCSES